LKIDIVYTWVDGSDPVWIKKKSEKTKQIGNILPTSNHSARFTDNDELKFSLRSIEKYAPWVNKIFIVTDNQTPSWLNLSNSIIEIIDHRDIFTNNKHLPTFSARVIESQLHHISELSEHFIYFNDDMFLSNNCSPDFFFSNNNKPYVFVSEIIPIPSKKSFDISKRDESKRNDHQHAIVNTRKVIRNKFKKSLYNNVRHGPKPLLKSILFQLEELFKSELEDTIKNSFRTKGDILMIHLFEYYVLLKNIGKARYLKTVSKKDSFLDKFSTNHNTFGYINLHEDNVENNLRSIKERKPVLLCLNQTPDSTNRNIELIKDFLAELFPNKSQFEI
jgi:hypothetical protein